MLVFSVYIPFLISRVRPVHSIFEKKSILENPSQIFTNLFFHAYMAYMPSFFAWLFRPAFKDNKVISSFSTFLRLLLSFFNITRIISRFSESHGALRIASLVSASLLFFLSVFSLSIFSCFLFTFFLSCSLFFLLSHLTFPASFRYSLRLFSFFFLYSLFLSIFSCFLFTFFLLFIFSLLFSFFLSHLTFPAYLSLLSHYPLIDSEQCDNRFS